MVKFAAMSMDQENTRAESIFYPCDEKKLERNNSFQFCASLNHQLLILNFFSHHHMWHRGGPAAGAGGTDRVGLDIIDHAWRQVGKGVAGRRALRQLQHHGGRGCRRQTPGVSGRTRNRRHPDIKFAAADAQRGGEAGRHRQITDGLGLRFLRGKTAALKNRNVTIASSLNIQRQRPDQGNQGGASGIFDGGQGRAAIGGGGQGGGEVVQRRDHRRQRGRGRGIVLIVGQRHNHRADIHDQLAVAVIVEERYVWFDDHGGPFVLVLCSLFNVSLLLLLTYGISQAYFMPTVFRAAFQSCHDQQNVLHDQQNVLHDQQNVLHDQQNVLHDQQNVLHDQQNVLHDQQNVLHDQQNVLH